MVQGVALTLQISLRSGMHHIAQGRACPTAALEVYVPWLADCNPRRREFWAPRLALGLHLPQARHWEVLVTVGVLSDRKKLPCHLLGHAG